MIQNYALTTILWLEALAKKEIEKLGGKIEKVQDKALFFSWEEKLLARINLWSRIGNKLFLVLWKKENIHSFDKLYDFVSWVDWKGYIPSDAPIIIKAKSIKSKLSSEPAIQKITKKAIIDVLSDKKDILIRENNDLSSFEIQVLLQEDTCFLLLNTSWNALHKRGYRLEAWEAPIKENLWAALVILAHWNYKTPFYDPFCGSGTIPIEALMIAKNIAPWIKRNFAFENRNWYDKKYLEEEKKEAREKIYSTKYDIFGFDSDKEMIEKAKKNLKNMGYEDEIHFKQKDFYLLEKQKLVWSLVSNPPYWLRLQDKDLDTMYQTINKLFFNNKDISGGIITSFEWGIFHPLTKKYKKRKLYNGNELCYFYIKNYEKNIKNKK